MLRRWLCSLLVCCFVFSALPVSLAEESLILPASLTEIGEDAFAGTHARCVALPEGAKTIGSGAFANCVKLESIYIPESVDFIADDAFDGCTKLTIRCAPGSAAAEFAELAGIPWRDAALGDEIPVSEVLLNVSGLTLDVGESAVLEAQVLPENASNAELIWSSSDAAIAMVSGGKVSAKSSGIAVITAEAADGSGAKADCIVQVSPASGAITFSGLNADASSTNAYLYVKAAAQASGSFSSMGLRMWDDQGRLAVDYTKSISTASKTSTTVWFDVFSDSGVQLEPGAAYTCQMHVVYNGNTYWTDFSSLTAKAAVEIEDSLNAVEIVENLKTSSNTSVLPSSKKTAMVTMAEELLSEDYSPAFVAGVLANIYYEGTFGKFESSKYSSNEPAYLVYMDENYDYRNKYSGKLIYNGISLSELDAMLDELAAVNYKGKFGLGSVQWTGGRTRNLVDLYIQEAAGKDTITLEQVIAAEVKMIKNELAGAYKSIYTKWQTTYAEDPYADDAACGAGYRVCVSYEVPATYRSKAVTRGQKAREVYRVMMGG